MTMLGISFLIMYAVMFLNVDSIDHVYISLTRTYISLLMVSAMALLMLGMMGKMYPDKRMNTLIITASISVFIGTLVLLRRQTFVGDHQWMKAMIPHHSSAILTSKHATLNDPEAKQLSVEIIKAQEAEIANMKRLLDKLDR
ncbi:DUF305 domain-containing protein [Spirosoma areae]